MNFVDVELRAQELIDQLGTAKYADNKKIMREALVLIRELAKDLAPMDESSPPKAGSFDG